MTPTGRHRCTQRRRDFDSTPNVPVAEFLPPKRRDPKREPATPQLCHGDAIRTARGRLRRKLWDPFDASGESAASRPRRCTTPYPTPYLQELHHGNELYMMEWAERVEWVESVEWTGGRASRGPSSWPLPDVAQMVYLTLQAVRGLETLYQCPLEMYETVPNV